MLIGGIFSIAISISKNKPATTTQNPATPSITQADRDRMEKENQVDEEAIKNSPIAEFSGNLQIINPTDMTFGYQKEQLKLTCKEDCRKVDVQLVDASGAMTKGSFNDLKINSSVAVRYVKETKKIDSIFLFEKTVSGVK